MTDCIHGSPLGEPCAGCDAITAEITAGSLADVWESLTSEEQDAMLAALAEKAAATDEAKQARAEMRAQLGRWQLERKVADAEATRRWQESERRRWMN